MQLSHLHPSFDPSASTLMSIVFFLFLKSDRFRGAETSRGIAEPVLVYRNDKLFFDAFWDCFRLLPLFQF